MSVRNYGSQSAPDPYRLLLATLTTRYAFKVNDLRALTHRRTIEMLRQGVIIAVAAVVTFVTRDPYMSVWYPILYTAYYALKSRKGLASVTKGVTDSPTVMRPRFRNCAPNSIDELATVVADGITKIGLTWRITRDFIPLVAFRAVLLFSMHKHKEAVHCLMTVGIMMQVAFLTKLVSSEPTQREIVKIASEIPTDHRNIDALLTAVLDYEEDVRMEASEVLARVLPTADFAVSSGAVKDMFIRLADALNRLDDNCCREALGLIERSEAVFVLPQVERFARQLYKRPNGIDIWPTAERCMETLKALAITGSHKDTLLRGSQLINDSASLLRADVQPVKEKELLRPLSTTSEPEVRH